MITKNYRVKTTLKVLILAASLMLFSYLFFKTGYIVLTILTGCLIISQVISLIRQTEKTNRDLSRFLLSIKYDDSSQAFVSSGLGSSFSELKSAFREVMQKLHESRAEKEMHSRYLQTIVQHIGIGLIAYKGDGEIDLINNSAKKILGIPSLQNINELRNLSDELADILLDIKSGRKALIKIEQDSEMLHLSLRATVLRMINEEYKLISIQNIHDELEEKEMEAWQKLIRVLTHEIMNSMTPISSMAATLIDLLKGGEDDEGFARDELDAEELEDIASALKTIHKRSQGLMNFVNAYRNLTLVPKPDFRIISVFELFDRIENLMKKKLEDQKIEFSHSIQPKTLELTADSDLIEQVIINLILNASHAVAGRENPNIHIDAFLDKKGKIVITVKDNGPGIVEEALKKVFIPFFTTKKEGSGIGLSLSKQIMRLHNGSISVESKLEEETVFTLIFP